MLPFPFMLLWESICSLSLVLIQEHSGGKLSTNGASDDQSTMSGCQYHH